MKQVVACKAVIVRDGKLLLLRESSAHVTNTKAGKYQFPGGRIEPGEPYFEGLKREVLEETGLHVTDPQPFFVGEWFPNVLGEQLHIVGIFFTCRDDGGKVAISDEHDEYQWVDLRLAQTLDIMTPDNQVVMSYFST